MEWLEGVLPLGFFTGAARLFYLQGLLIDCNRKTFGGEGSNWYFSFMFNFLKIGDSCAALSQKRKVGYTYFNE